MKPAAAMLAGLPQAPALYNPFTNMEAAKARQEVVEILEGMTDGSGHTMTIRIRCSQ